MFLCFVSLIAFSLLCVYLPIYAKEQNQLSQQVFFQKSPDVIEGKLAFDEDTKATPLKKALSSLLSTIRSNKE